MGRSVSYPHDSIVAFAPYEDEGDWSWQDYLDCLSEHARELFPSFEDFNSWIGREDHALLRNGFCYFGVSEYCGLVAIWLAKRADLDGSVDAMADRWMAQVASRFTKAFGALRHIGTASNGEAFFERIEA